MCSRTAQGRVFFVVAIVLLVGSARSAETRTVCGSRQDLPVVLSVEDGSAALPTSRPSDWGPDQSQVIRDPLPPAVWSGGSMFVLGGTAAVWRRLRRGLR